MQEHSQKKRSRTAKLLGGALVGTILSVGAVAGSASAAKYPTSTDGDLTAPVLEMARASGIRW